MVIGDFSLLAQDIIKEAKKYHKRVRAVGAGHSWSPIFPDDGDYLVFTEKLKPHPIRLEELPSGQKVARLWAGHNGCC